MLHLRDALQLRDVTSQTVCSPNYHWSTADTDTATKNQNSDNFTFTVYTANILTVLRTAFCSVTFLTVIRSYMIQSKTVFNLKLYSSMSASVICTAIGCDNHCQITVGNTANDYKLAVNICSVWLRSLRPIFIWANGICQTRPPSFGVRACMPNPLINSGYVHTIFFLVGKKFFPSKMPGRRKARASEAAEKTEPRTGRHDGPCFDELAIFP